MSYGKNTLGAVGKEDGYLTYNAKNTFFKKMYGLVVTDLSKPLTT